MAHVWPIVSPLNPFATPLGSATKLVDTDSFVSWKASDRARNSFMICRPLNNTPIQPATLKLKDRPRRKIFFLHNKLFIPIIFLKICTNLFLLIIPTVTSTEFKLVSVSSYFFFAYLLSPILARLFSCRLTNSFVESFLQRSFVSSSTNNENMFSKHPRLTTTIFHFHKFVETWRVFSFLLSTKCAKFSSSIKTLRSQMRVLTHRVA